MTQTQTSPHQGHYQQPNGAPSYNQPNSAQGYRQAQPGQQPTPQQNAPQGRQQQGRPSEQQQRAKDQFVAYETRSHVSHDETTGQPHEFRAQTHMTRYLSVKVLQHKFTNQANEQHPNAGNNSWTFDAASVGIPGFRKDFSVNLENESPGTDILMQAEQQGLPVTLYVEHHRRAKQNDKDKALVPFDAPILTLKGATQKDRGFSSNAESTQLNCSTIVAAVGPVGGPLTITSECESNPDEWDYLIANRNDRGQCAPTGWVLSRTSEGVLNGIIRDTANPAVSPNATPTANLDMVQLAKLVAEELRPAMKAVADPTARPRPNRTNEGGPLATEARPFDVWNTDGSVNAGGYLASKSRAVYTDCLKRLIDVAALDNLESNARRLAAVWEWMVDRTHTQAVGERARLPRTQASHKESAMWVEVVVDRLSLQGPDADGVVNSYAFDPAILAEDAREQCTRWATAVSDKAAELQRQCLAGIEAYDKSRDLSNRPARQQQNPQQGQPQNPQQGPAVVQPNEQQPARQGQPQGPAQGPNQQVQHTQQVSAQQGPAAAATQQPGTPSGVQQGQPQQETPGHPTPAAENVTAGPWATRWMNVLARLNVPVPLGNAVLAGRFATGNPVDLEDNPDFQGAVRWAEAHPEWVTGKLAELNLARTQQALPTGQ